MVDLWDLNPRPQQAFMLSKLLDHQRKIPFNLTKSIILLGLRLSLTLRVTELKSARKT
jgi:hypothetical protein